MKNLRICLVDDDKDDRETFQDAFNELNSDNVLMTFKNGLEAIDYLNAIEDVPDIIFLDLNMPIMGGLETLREIRKNERYKLLSVVIYSTSSSEKDIEETLVAGANIYITKPTNYRVLKDMLTKVMKMNWQYHTSELDKDTFVFAI
ncbi:response regulator receiver domain-containing protein [Flavobacterium endophyticum]|jgi:CheY-like chemotaxis protein|uniref:Response regulator receiver domain-containing protein n=1 Tax=Flavobacterium endophyticum TaxID=1540163 RepID=A0A495M6M9_9FLAO|nr:MULTISPECIES: response regulator [Flavobacterium]RKS21747.1 response regulator receiver domain-containing protein [Flavobacterium endophyticum]WDO14558.1 response regulator [Flavobacterium sp. WW92]